MNARLVTCLLLTALLSTTTRAERRQMEQIKTMELSDRLKLYDGEGGASCSEFMGNVLSWQRRGGDWRDASQQLFGDKPHSIAKSTEQTSVWDVSPMVRALIMNGEQHASFFLRPVKSSGYIRFHSREARGVTDWPMLILELSDGSREILKPSADSTLDCSSYKSIGRAETLDVSSQHNSVLQFILPTLQKGQTITRARLVLSKIISGGMLNVGVFAIEKPKFPATAVIQGLAFEYSVDHDIERHPDVLFATSFDESGNWQSRWAKGAYGETDIVGDDPSLRFSPLSGSALRINLKKGSNLGFEARLKLKDHGGEPDELYFRYYLRLANDWNPNVASGKLPGMAGTYGEAGWGGRRVDGSNGWSLRGMFVRSFPKDHPMTGFTQLATYAYHAEMTGFYGDNWMWPGALLERNRWYSIEQYVRLNRPGVSDGVMRVWVDGRLAMERTKIRMRNVDRLHIETVWLNAYHGGAETSPHDQHFYIDNVVVARRYIGPIGGISASNVNSIRK